jgi:hypothetical protein
VVDHGAGIPVDTFLRFFGRPIEVRGPVGRPVSQSVMKGACVWRSGGG